MPNKVGSGRAVGADSGRASGEATRGALEGLGGASPSLGFVSASPSLSLSEGLRSASQVARGARLIGCTTAGEFNQSGLVHGGVVVMLLATDSPHLVQTAPGVAGAGGAAGRQLCRGFHGLGEAGRQNGFHRSTTVTPLHRLSGAGGGLVPTLVGR